MRYLYGFVGRGRPPGSGPLPGPAGARPLWGGADPLYLCGDWAERDVRVMRCGQVRAAVVGTCLATPSELTRLLARAVADGRGDYTPLAAAGGDHWLVVADRRGVTVFADAAALRPMYFTVLDGVPVYGSSALALHRLTGAPVDAGRIAVQLVAMAAADISQRATFFAGIEAVPPGHHLLLGGPAASPRRHVAPRPAAGGLDERAALLREALDRSVAHRVSGRDRVTADLSGGLDSTSLTLIAADRLAVCGQRLAAFTYGAGSPHEQEDVRLAVLAAGTRANLDHTVIPDGDYPLPYSRMDQVPLTEEPLVFQCVTAKLATAFDAVRASGSRVHLSGEGGDPAVLAARSYLADLCTPGRLTTLVAHSYGWSRTGLGSPKSWLTEAVRVRRTPYGRWLRQWADPGRRARPGEVAVGWTMPPSRASWYTADAAEHARRAYAAQAATDPAGPPGAHRSLVDLQFTGRIARMLRDFAELHGVDIHFPYLDRHVLDVCLSTAPEIRTSPHVFKPLLKAACRDVLPAELLDRSSKGDFTGGMFAGMHANAGAVLDLLDGSLLADHGVIDLGRLRAAVSRFGSGLAVGLPALNYTLAVELWLRRLQSAAPTAGPSQPPLDRPEVTLP